jgi:hypothetical protein
MLIDDFVLEAVRLSKDENTRLYIIPEISLGPTFHELPNNRFIKLNGDVDYALITIPSRTRQLFGDIKSTKKVERWTSSVKGNVTLVEAKHDSTD